MTEFYIYVHYKKGTDTPFYVGKGSNNRAYCVHNRNKYWRSTVAKYGYVVEIIENNLTEDEAHSAEIYLISMLRFVGFKLVNLTSGGEGKSSDTAKYNKHKLVLLANNGEHRPSQRTELGKALANYISPARDGYDEKFAKLIQSLRPDWFIGPRLKSTKTTLLTMAKNGEVRPNYLTKLGKALSRYTSATGVSYDEEFTEQIKILRPEWFNSLRTAKIKHDILDRARRNLSRPKQTTKLGRALNKYSTTNHESYDKELVEQLKLLRPDWFRSTVRHS